MPPYDATAASPRATFHRLQRAWARSDQLFDLVGRDRWLEQGIVLRHPYLFYVGHLAAFAWNQLSGALGKGRFEAHFDHLFELGIDPENEAEAKKLTPPAWPGVDEVIDYRDGVRAALAAHLPQIEARAPHEAVVRDLMPLVLEHELMHHETLVYMIHQMAPESLQRPPAWRDAVPAATAPVTRDPVPIAAGSVRLGADPGEIPFGWDNEFPSHTVDVAQFHLDRVPITCGEYAQFVQAGGYTTDTLWAAGDLEWLAISGRDLPIAWRRGDGGLEVRSLFAWYPLDAVRAWPVYVSHAEASAYCRWAGTRLATEAELHRAAFYGPDGQEREFPWGDAAAGEHAPLDYRVAGCVPVGSHPALRSAFGVDELVGNGWEWTSTPFMARPGFAPILEHYPTYSANFFDGNHYVVFGASWATDLQLVRRSFRNWYQRRYPYVFATFRTARSAAGDAP